MKKYIGIALAVLMVLGLSGMAMAGNTTQSNFSVLVDPYIDVLASVQNFGDSGSHVTGPSFGPKAVPHYTGSIGPWPGGVGDFAYVNCPFQLAVNGDNPAGDGKPIYAREEVDGTGTGLNRYDRLNTNWEIRIHYNGGYPIGVYANASTFPWTLTSNEAPHNGWVGIDFMCNGNWVDGPDANIDRSQTHDQSVDSGRYKASVTIIASVIPGYTPTP